MNQIQNKHTIASIDLAKIFFCCCIIALHTNVLSIIDSDIYYYIKKIVFRSAVPFFFVTSGYFLGKKIKYVEDTNKCIMNYCKRLLLPLVVFSIINYIELDAAMLSEGRSLMSIVLSNIRSSLFYPPGALWFVWACIIGSIMLIPFFKRNKLGLALILGIVLYVWALICNNYYFIIFDTSIKTLVDQYTKIFISPRNGIFLGFILLTIGACCSRIKVPRKTSYALLLMSFTFLLAEVFLLKDRAYADEGSLYISQLLFIPSLLLVLLNTDIYIPYDISITMRKLSVGMYYLHKPILFIVSFITMSVVVRFLTTLIVALAICLLSYNSKFKKLEQLLS